MLSDVVAVEPRHALGLNYLGYTLFRLSKAKEAEKSFRGALQVDPNFAAAHYGLAQLLENTGRTDEAVAEYEKTLALQSNHEDAARALAELKKKSR